jgi:hypothetical protein
MMPAHRAATHPNASKGSTLMVLKSYFSSVVSSNPNSVLQFLLQKFSFVGITTGIPFQ